MRFAGTLVIFPNLIVRRQMCSSTISALSPAPIPAIPRLNCAHRHAGLDETTLSSYSLAPPSRRIHFILPWVARLLATRMVLHARVTLSTPASRLADSHIHMTAFQLKLMIQTALQGWTARRAGQSYGLTSEKIAPYGKDPVQQVQCLTIWGDPFHILMLSVLLGLAQFYKKKY